IDAGQVSGTQVTQLAGAQLVTGLLTFVAAGIVVAPPPPMRDAGGKDDQLGARRQRDPLIKQAAGGEEQGGALVVPTGCHGVHDADASTHELVLHTLSEQGNLQVVENKGKGATQSTHEADRKRSAR